MTCVTCGKDLLPDEIGATKKLVNRGATEFYCLDCLSKRFDVPRQRLEQKIEEWRSMGCLLFEQK